jgi:hypothetical protein
MSAAMSRASLTSPAASSENEQAAFRALLKRAGAQLSPTDLTTPILVDPFQFQVRPTSS